MMVDKWCSVGWLEKHNAYRERRLMMQGAPHHQGNLTLNAYAAKWVRVIHFFIVTLNSA
jgi:hypothetical protein